MSCEPHSHTVAAYVRNDLSPLCHRAYGPQGALKTVLQKEAFGFRIVFPDIF